jgi:hypothetical protein
LELEPLPEDANPNWRSKVLTPILQRQLQGIPDPYAPAIHTAISNCSRDDDDDVYEDGEDEDANDVVTISDATKFYLGTDPLDPSNLPTFRRNLVYIREVRWYLQMLFENGNLLSDRKCFDRSINNQDYLINTVDDDEIDEDEEEDEEEEDDGVPLLSSAEASTIYFEHLEEFFKEELERVVSVFTCSLSTFYLTLQS